MSGKLVSWKPMSRRANVRAGWHSRRQAGRRPVRKWGENEEMERERNRGGEMKWRERGVMETEREF